MIHLNFFELIPLLDTMHKLLGIVVEVQNTICNSKVFGRKVKCPYAASKNYSISSHYLASLDKRTINKAIKPLLKRSNLCRDAIERMDQVINAAD
jgi:hypothetical protein